mmetsp:Transcript_17614/g.17581  ORF Transcript_17614/g.17581 Transcript_17614/m.17581 type:complete len:108 (+) Transcript_17614:2-325(+)
MARYLYASEVKIVLLSSTQAGKSCIASQFLENRFIESYFPTAGVEFRSKPYSFRSQYIRVHIWDTGSQEGYKPESLDFFNEADGFAIVFDVSRRESFDGLGSIFSQI